MKNRSVICIPLNTELSDGCDYAIQSIRVLSERHIVYAMVLSDPRSWKDLFKIVQQKKQLWTTVAGVQYIYPFYVLPFQRVSWIRELNLFLNFHLLKMLITIKHSNANKILWFFEPQHAKTFLNVFHPFYKVFDMVDDFFAKERDSELQKYVLQHTDLLAVNSSTLHRRYKPHHKNIIQVPLGFSLELFKKTSRQFKEKKLTAKKMVVGFVGGLNYRFEFKLLFLLIENFPDIIFRFIGPQQQYLIEGDYQTEKNIKKLLNYPNVEYIPNQPKENIPQFIRQFDIALIPYDLKYPFNKYCFPMKVMEYMYVGKPVLTTPIVELKKYQHLLHMGTSFSHFKKHIENLMKVGWPKEKQLQQRNITLDHTWEKKVNAILRYVDGDKA
jgi:glycosyltransferase involved in cell wall biosynthesis